MKWTLEYLPEALDDLESLDNSIRGPVIKGINKVLTNPLPKAKGGYGTPLGNKEGLFTSISCIVSTTLIYFPLLK